MDKRNQMENPFFDPDKPGSIFVGMDRYHQYSPHQPRNALTFIQKGDADSLFRKFLIDNIKEAECCPYIPDTELLRFDLANMRQVPPVDTHTPFEEYISKELLPYAKEFEKVTQVKSAGEFDTGKFKRLSTEIRKAADGILKRDFDVRGHRSLENMLNDSTVTFTVGSRKLNEVQKTALASGYALYLPENNKEATRHLLFCKADFEQGRIEGSSKPFGVRTYVIKDGLLCPLPEEKNTVKKTENKNRHNNNRLK